MTNNRNFINFILVTLLATGCVCTSLRAAESTSKETPFLVVIDPGHGGEDRGAEWKSGSRRWIEKDLTLKLAIQTQRALRAKGIQAILTRRKDQTLTLAERTAVANRVSANAFISIHMNASGTHTPSSHQAQGVETYILNNSTDQTSIRLAQLENTVLKGSTVSENHNSDVALILKDMMLDANLGESKLLACLIQDQLVTATSNKFSRQKKDRGVRQALFHVLLGADMPSALIEAGFLDHPRDRQLVDSPEDRNRMGKALAEAIAAYRTILGSPEAATLVSSCKVH